MSVRLWRITARLPLDGFLGNLVLEIFFKSFEKIQIWLKPYINMGHFTWRLKFVRFRCCRETLNCHKAFSSSDVVSEFRNSRGVVTAIRTHCRVTLYAHCFCCYKCYVQVGECAARNIKLSARSILYKEVHRLIHKYVMNCIEILLPQSPRHFSWQRSAPVSQTLRSSYFRDIIAAAT
jgi:hypothetical protein